MSDKLLQTLLEKTNKSINKEVKRVRSEVWKGASFSYNETKSDERLSSPKRNETKYAK